MVRPGWGQHLADEGQLLAVGLGAYLETCRKLAREWQVDGRTLDRALYEADGNTVLP